MTTTESPTALQSSSRVVTLAEDIRSRTAGLSRAEQQVARVVLADSTGVFEMSVTGLATASGTSVGTVVRFCQRLGLRGFQDLKLRLARETPPVDVGDSSGQLHGDDVGGVLVHVLTGSARALQDAAGSVDPTVMDRVVERLIGARRILFVAVGTSAPLASDIAYRLTTVGLPAVFPADVHVQHVTARMLGPEDVCFAISHTGSTTETLSAVRSAADSGATTVALTSFVDSPLTAVADQVLVAGSQETSYRIEAMTSRLVHLAVLDAVYVAVTLRDPRSPAALAATADVLVEHRF